MTVFFRTCSSRLFVAMALCVLPCAATAQSAPPASSAALLPADQKALDEARSLKRLEGLWDRPLDWKEANASLSSLVAGVRGSLGEGAPRIEVRTRSAVSTTFALDKALLGRTLCSLAQLANCRVWVFFDHFVIAPEEALSNAERAAVERGAGGDWAYSEASKLQLFGGGKKETWSGEKQELRVCLRVVSTDLKAKLAAKSATSPAPVAAPPVADAPKTRRGDEKPPLELPFGELSPASQRVVQELVDEKLGRFGRNLKEGQSGVLSPSVVVCFDDSPTSPHLFLRGTTLESYYTSWYIFDY